MKRVLFVSYLFPPMVAGGIPRVAQFCKYLPKFGWTPTALTGPLVPAAAVDPESLRELPDCVKVIRARCPLASRGIRGSANPRSGLTGFLQKAARFAMRLVLHPDRQVLWLRGAVRAGLEALERDQHDAILATYGPASNILVAERLAQASGLPLVLDFRDLWADLPRPGFATPIHRRLAARLERRALAAAARVTAVSQRMADHMAARHHLPPENVTAIPNGFDPADLEAVHDRREKNAPFRLIYCGSLYSAQHLDTFLEAVSELSAARKISPSELRLEFVGNLPPSEPRRFGIGDYVESHPYVPHRGVFDYLARADAMLLLEAPGYCGEMGYSVKLFDYALTGKPVLALADEKGNSARLLRELRTGRIVDSRDRAGIRSAIMELLKARGAAPKVVDIESPVLREFNRLHLVERLARVLTEASGDSPTVEA